MGKAQVFGKDKGRAEFFGLKVNGRFLFLTASAHLIFGIVLGLYCRAKLGRQLTAAGYGPAMPCWGSDWVLQ